MQKMLQQQQRYRRPGGLGIQMSPGLSPAITPGLNMGLNAVSPTIMNQPPHFGTPSFNTVGDTSLLRCDTVTLHCYTPLFSFLTFD